jgi:hypothetical protein
VGEREHEDVVEDLAGLQAKLRGEEPPEREHRVSILRPHAEPATGPDDIPRIHLEETGDTFSVSHGDVTVTGDASVIPLVRPVDPPVAEISDRLARLEDELADVLHGLEETEALIGPDPLPVEESTGDPFLDLQRLVARRLESDPGA